MYVEPALRQPIYAAIDLLSLYVLFSEYRSCDNTLEKFLSISFYSWAYVRIIYEKTKGQVPLGPLLGNKTYKLKRSIVMVLLLKPSL